MSIKNFNRIRIGLASPEKMKSWAFGEVKKPETINYRTLNPEMEGLFCERIFGPQKDWECACGKYKRMRYKGHVCEKCGVEITKSKVRRERMGSINLAAPVGHIWYSKGTPNKMALMAGITPKELEAVLYFAKYIVIEPGETNLEVGQLLTDREYKMYKSQHGKSFNARMGAEAILELLEKIDLVGLEAELTEELENIESVQKRKKLVKRLKIVRDFKESGNRPEWMILSIIPVIPADLRPMVQLDGGRFATSDLNDLYRRVINRNNRLKKLMDIHAPEIVIKNEKRMLQEAVDALIDNGRRGKPVVTQNNRELKSLSDMLKGKQGRFRQNLLGKRVDYSGRSVIVVGPNLKMNECGIPKKMALELYKPFIMRELVDGKIAMNIKTAKKMVENADDRVWEIIEDVIRDHPVLLNRAPTLHRLSIQAFDPVLIEGKAIRLHPLVCAAFNADFDGDQMAVHLCLSPEAIMEAKLLMLAPNNIIAPSNGQPIAVPSQDMVMGCYYMTNEKHGAKGEGKIFSNLDQAILAYDNKLIETHALIKVRVTSGEIVETTAGRILFNKMLPEKVRDYSETFGKGQLKDLISKIYHKYGFTVTSELINDIKNFGYHYAAFAGVTVGIEDLEIPASKKIILEKADKEIEEIESDYRAGNIINEERYRKTVTVWHEATEQVTVDMMNNLDKFNPVYMMANSGARGSLRQMRQLGGMRGLMSNTQGKTLETPIKANFREGLTVMEFFMSSHGARKGLADTALRTADSGYLTRRLVDISHDVIINEDDCGTHEGITVADLKDGPDIIEHLKERIYGRILVEDLTLSTGEIIERNTLLRQDSVDKIMADGIEAVKIRSPLTCDLPKGICRKCYGIDLSNHKDILLGEAVGVVAAQSIGEPGTQLTMRTFHTGGVAEAANTQTALYSDVRGKVKFNDIRTLEDEKTGEIRVVSQNAKIKVGAKFEYDIPSGSILRVEDEKMIKKGAKIVDFDPYHTPIITEVDGIVEYRELHVKNYEDKKFGVSENMVIKPVEEGTVSSRMVIFSDTDEREKIAEYIIPIGAYLMVEEEKKVKRGEVLAKIMKIGDGGKDITGGLPRVQELFEARNPKGKAIVSEVDGIVNILDKKKKGMRVVHVVSEKNQDDFKEYLIPFGEHLLPADGGKIIAGERLTDGVISPHDVLAIKGFVEAEQYILESVQQVYREQGVTVSDKHIEVIVKQMFKKVRILKAGSSLYLEDEIVEKRKVEKENEILREKGKNLIEFEHVIQGITKAAVNTDSFISAASFQETTKVLSNAAIQGKIDTLQGLKENVIIGKKIPAGTGFMKYKNVEPDIKVKIEVEAESEIEEQEIVE